MTHPEKYAPKHRAPGKHKRKRDPLAALRTSATRPALAVTGLAVAVTGAAVATGVMTGGPDTADLAAAKTADSTGSSTTEAAALASAYVERREEPVARSDRREAQDPAKAAALTVGAGVTTTHERTLSDEAPRDIARALLADFGFADSQFGCLDSLWTKESGWNPSADNPASSAYGIPQALPGSKMASAGADWATNPETQITWGLGYIQSRYGSPCSAWSHSQSHNWY